MASPPRGGDDVAKAPTTPDAAQGDVERDALMDRLTNAARAVPHNRHLEQVVEMVEALRKDFDERALFEVESDAAEDALRKSRQPALLKQVAFYMSDVNLRHDWFLREKIETSPGGYLSLALLLPFNRLRQLGVTTVAEVSEAVESAPASAGLELGFAFGQPAVRRAGGTPLPPAGGAGGLESPSARDLCTVRIAGFPKNDEGVTVEAVRKLVEHHGEIAHVWLVRSRGEPVPPATVGEFTGVVEVEFATTAAAEAAIAADPAPKWSDAALSLQGLPAFRAQRASKRTLGGDGDDWEDGPAGKRPRLEEEAQSMATRMERGVVLKLEGLPESISWREIKDVFDEFGEVVFVDHENGQSNACVRMRDADGIAAVMKAAEPLKGRLPVRWAWALGADDSVDPPAEAPPAAAETEGKETTADPYGGGAEPAPVGSPAEVAADPYGGAADAEAPAKAADDADADPFVVDTAGAEPVAAATTAPTGGSSEPTISVVALEGDEEEKYIQKIALVHAERRLRENGKKGKKGGKDGKKGKGKDGKKGDKGKGKKGKKGGKGKRMDFDSDSN